MTAPLLETESLSVRYRSGSAEVRAVDAVSIRVAAGEAVGVVGESGSGKSTFVHALLGLLPTSAAQSGRVVFGGREISGLSDKELATIRGGSAAMVFQDPMKSFDPLRTIGYHLHESLRVHRPSMGRRERTERLVEQLRKTGLPEPAYQSTRYPHQLSGGMLQRSMLALALANDPALLLADEPTTALDVTIQAQILELFRELMDAETPAASMLLISHDLAVVRQVCSRILVMYAGRVVEDAPTESIFADPRHPYTQALIRATPRATRARGRLTTIPGTTPIITGEPTGCAFRDRCAHVLPRCHVEVPELEAVEPGRAAACFVSRSQLPAATTVAAERTTEGSGTGVEHAITRVSDSDLPAAVELRDVWVTFRASGRGSGLRRTKQFHALRDVSLAVRRGETLGIVGESGSGKSTLARTILGLQDPSAGSVSIGGVVRSGRGRSDQAGRGLQAVFQDPHGSLNPRMTIEEAIAEPLRNMGVPPARRRERAVQLLDEVQLGAAFASRYPGELSGGQAQRVAIARALASEPEVIVLDEPTSGLDISIQAHILNLLAELQDRRGLTYVLISHDLAVVQHLADRVAVMYLGRVVELSESDTIFSSPAHPYTVGLLAAVPDVDATQRPAVLAVGEPPSPLNPPSGCAYHRRCAIAAPMCSVDTPELEQFGAGTVACHFPGDARNLTIVNVTAPGASEEQHESIG